MNIKTFLALTVAAAFALVGCGVEPLPPAAPAKDPPCHDLAPGDELPDGAGANVSCLAACTNVAGGWTCIKAGGVTVYCDVCGAP